MQEQTGIIVIQAGNLTSAQELFLVLCVTFKIKTNSSGTSCEIGDNNCDANRLSERETERDGWTACSRKVAGKRFNF